MFFVARTINELRNIFVHSSYTVYYLKSTNPCVYEHVRRRQPRNFMPMKLMILQYKHLDNHTFVIFERDVTES